MQRVRGVRYLLVAALAAGTVGLAGCGDDGDDASSAVESAQSQVSEAVSSAVESAASEGDPAAGKTVFMSAGCVGCHTLADAGATGTVGPNLDQAQPPAELVVDRVTNGQGVMPPFKDSLSEQQIQDVAAYVSSVTG